MNHQAPIVVLGEGSSAVFLISELLQKNETILWVPGTGSRLLSPQPQMLSDRALIPMMRAAETLGVSNEEEIRNGALHRVYRNKGFKPVQESKFIEQTWTPETSCIGVTEYQIEGLNPVLLEEQLRAQFENHPSITRVQNSRVIEFEVYPSGGKIQFSNGLISEFKQFYYCDDLAALRQFPKLMPIFKNQMSTVKATSRVGALQVVFHHSEPLKQRFDSGIVIPMNREAGETFDRDALGYFVEPNRSVWTVFLQPSECEENHEIMKKLRKLKQSLNRAFESPEFLPEGKADFMSTVEREQVRFEENALFTEGFTHESASNPDFVLMVDSFGFSRAMEHLADHCEAMGSDAPSIEAGIPEYQPSI